MMYDEPKLLVDWEPRWQGFTSSIRPGLSRSPRPLAGEIRTDIDAHRTAPASFALHALALAAVFAASQIHPDIPMHTLAQDLPSYEVVYYPGTNLPAVEDASGASSGREGVQGGRREQQGRQVLRVARGNDLTDQVIQAPSLPKVSPDKALTDSLMLSAAIPEMPSAAVPSSRRSLQLPSDVVPPRVDPTTAGSRRMNLLAGDVIAPPIDATVAKPHLPVLAGDVVGPATEARVSGRRLQGLIEPVGPAVDEGAILGSSSRRFQPGGVEAVAPAVDAAAISGRSSNGRMVGGAFAPTVEGLVISAHPGNTLGTYGDGRGGMLALSPKGLPNGGGLGGNGTGGGSGNGAGPGNGSIGNGPGAGTTGEGKGSTVGAATGFGPGKGPGGAGNGNAPGSGVTVAAVPGSDVITNVVNIPSFGGPSNASSNAVRTSQQRRNAPRITVVATSRSGGAMNLYGRLQGGRVYTIYIDTSMGVTVMQYATHQKTSGTFDADLVAPEVMDSELPAGIHKARVIISCLIDRAGTLRNVKVIEAASTEAASQITSALERWRFRPALRGDEAVEIDAILGFQIDTR